MNVLMIGAHPDDLELRCAGLAKMYVNDGNRVRFLSMCDGSGGHHIMDRRETAIRRYGETREAAKVIGVEYDVWNIPDCEIMADLPTRERLIRYIRDFKPDIVFSHRSNDYHADHRNSALLVQDASYMLIVPNCCPDTPAMKEMPVIMHFEDRFMNPPFVPDVVVGIDSVIEDKFRMLNCHVSQVYEWLPYTDGYLDKVPTDPDERYKFLKGDKVDADTPDELILSGKLFGYGIRFARTASRFRKELEERYGEKGRRIVYAESYSLSEYGTQLTEETKKQFFPY